MQFCNFHRVSSDQISVSSRGTIPKIYQFFADEIGGMFAFLLSLSVSLSLFDLMSKNQMLM